MPSSVSWLIAMVSAIATSSRPRRAVRLQAGAVSLVAEPHLARLHLTSADSGERGERSARVGLDPHMDHRHGLELDERRVAVAAAVGQTGDMRRRRVVGEAEV